MVATCICSAFSFTASVFAALFGEKKMYIKLIRVTSDCEDLHNNGVTKFIYGQSG